MAVAIRPTAWRQFWREVREALCEELWEEVKEELLQRAIKYLYKLISRRRAEPGPAQFPDLGRFLLADNETASEAIIFGPRPGPSFRLGDGNPRPGFLMFIDYGVARPRPPSSSVGVDHVQVPDCFYFPSDMERYVFPEFALRAPPLGPVLGCGAAPLLPPPPRRFAPPAPTSGPGALPSAPATPPAAPGYMWYWIAAGVTAAAVAVAVLYFERTRRSQRRRAEALRMEQEARRAEELRLEQQARRAEELRLEQQARRAEEEADSTTEEATEGSRDGDGEGQARPPTSSTTSQGPHGV